MWKQKRREQFNKRVPDYGKHDRKDYNRDQRRDDRGGAERPADKPREPYEAYSGSYDRDANYDREGAYREPEGNRNYVDEREERDRGYWEGDARDARDSHYQDGQGRARDEGYREECGRAADESYREDRGRAGDEGYRQELDRERDRNEYFVHGDVRDVTNRDRDYVRDRDQGRGRDFGGQDRDYGREEELDRNRGYDRDNRDRDRDYGREEDYDRSREFDRGVDDAARHREDERVLYRDGRDGREGYKDDRVDYVGGGRDWGDERAAQPGHWDDYREGEQPYRAERAEYREDGQERYEDGGQAYRQDRGRDTADIVSDTRNRLAEADRAGGFRNDSSRRGRDVNSRNQGSNRARASTTRPGRSLHHNKAAPAAGHHNKTGATAVQKPASFQAAGKAVRKFGPRGGHHGQMRGGATGSDKPTNLKQSTQPSKNRFSQPTSKPAVQTNTSSDKRSKTADDRRSSQSARGQTFNKDCQTQQATKSFTKKSEHGSSNYKGSTHGQSSGSTVKPKSEVKPEVKQERKHSHSESEKFRQSSRDRNKRDSNHNADSKLEATKIYGSFHEEDAISILADDDHFTHETRRYLATDNVTSGKGKSVSSSKDRSKNSSSDYKSNQTRTDQSRDSRRKEDSRDTRDPKRSDTGRSQSRDSGTRDRNKGQYRHQEDNSHSKAGKVSSASDRGRKTDSNQPDRPYGQAGTDRYRHKNETGTYRDRNYTSKQSSDHNTSRSQPSSKVNNERVGRTGAILKDDRFNDKKNDKKHEGEDKRRGFRDNKSKHHSDRYRGFHSSDKVKKKYFGKGFGNKRTNVGYGKKDGEDGDDDNEHFSKFRNERDERDFDKRRSVDDEEMLNPNTFGTADQNQQQIIFIPNADFQEGHAPVLDQYGSSLVSPEVLSGQFPPPGQQQQMPVQFLPSNMAPPEAPPGTEYVFIPFVNDPASVPLTDSPAGVLDNKPGSQEVPAVSLMDTQTEAYTQKLSSQETAARKKIKPLTATQRAKIKWSLMKQRRQQLEKRVEQRILQRLMKNQAIEKQNAEKKKPTIKRISPPAATSTSARGSKGVSRAQRVQREQLDDVSGDDYDNVSDLEDVTDDEAGDYTRSGGKRPTFRKPGEPRLAVANEPRPTVRSKVVPRSVRDDSDQTEAWQDSDVRKVVERQSIPMKRGKTSVNNNLGAMAKKLKGLSGVQMDRPRTPIKITVSNDQFKYAADDDDQDDDEDDEGNGSRSRSGGSRSREVYDGDRRPREPDRRGPNTQGKYGKNYRDDRDRAQYSGRKESPRNTPQRQNDNTRGQYDDGGSDQNRRRKSRFSGGNDEGFQNQQGGRNRQGNTSNMGPVQGRNNNMGANQLQGNNFNMNNQGQQNFSGQYQQRQMSNVGNQFSSPQSQTFGFQQAGFNQPGFQMGSSDPSLPPVSQGPMNVPQFGQANPTDMSLPPTVNGPVAGAASPLLLNQNTFPQQNLQMQQQNLFPSAIQNQPFAQQQQQHNQQQHHQQHQQQQQHQLQQMNQPAMLGVGSVQSAAGMSQASLQNSGVQGRGGAGYQMSASPRYQQSPLRMGDQGTTLQQQQQQSVVGAIVPSSNQVQGSVQNMQQNQQSRPVVINSGIITNQQGFIAGQNNNRNESYMPATANDAMKNAKGIMKPNTSVRSTSNQSMVSQVQPMRQDKAQVFGTVRGAASMSAQRASAPAGRLAVRPKSAANQNLHQVNQRSASGGGNSNEMYASRPRASQASGLGDIDDDVGEMLCVRCEKVFLSESVMRRHSKWHVLDDADILELRCDSCQQGFTSSVAFNVHMREKHG